MGVDVLLILLAGFLDRVRGGASDWLARVTPIPKPVWRYASFFGFGAVLAALALPHAAPAAPLLFGLGMWGSGKLLGWSGVYGQMLGITEDREWWQKGPLRHPVLATIVVNLVWGGGGVLAVALFDVVTGASLTRGALAVPVALAIAGTAAPLIAKRIVPTDRWWVDERFFASTWGVMEFVRGLLAGLLCALS